MRINDLKIGAAVYWYVGQLQCEGSIIDIYNRKQDENNQPKERVLLIELAGGKKVVKLESTVIVRKQQNFG